MAGDRRQGRCWNGISRRRRDACRGSTITATATATDFKNTRPVLPSVTTTWAGRILETACVYPDGSLVKGPKALCELQGYVYDAWLRMAEIFDELSKPDRAGELRAKAAALFKRFNEAFWDEELGSYALALDGEKKKVLTIASNAGHCLWSGIVPPERAGKVVKRLMAPDMWSGWGIRTLSTRHPAFNPYNYQTGSVWPHDNAIVALGFKRYGFGAEAARIARDISDAASHFLSNQLPELYTTIERDEQSFPVQYLGANVPQAWAAGSVFALLQAILGFMPRRAAGKIVRRSVLPEWLPDLTVLDLRVGRTADLISASGARARETQFEVLQGDPKAIERSSFGAQLRASSSLHSAGRRMLTELTQYARSPHRIRQACTRSIG